MNLETVDEAIGIFDSGVGGISVLWDIQKLLPHEHLFFFGDNAYAPYGTKEPEVVRSRCMDIIQMMLDLPVKAVVIACNTASSVAAKTIREQVSIPVIAMEPALKPAHEIRHGGKILVLAKRCCYCKGQRTDYGRTETKIFSDVKYNRTCHG